LTVGADVGESVLLTIGVSVGDFILPKNEPIFVYESPIKFS
jgi:hypothetical protein